MRSHVRRSTSVNVVNVVVNVVNVVIDADAVDDSRRRRFDARRFEIRRQRRRQRRRQSCDPLLGFEELSSTVCRFERSLASCQVSRRLVSSTRTVLLDFVRLFRQVRTGNDLDANDVTSGCLTRD